MTKTKKSAIDFSNHAVIQDEILLTICLVLEDGWPAGPTFLHALNTIIETVVVHEEVYFDPLHQLGRDDISEHTVPGILRNSTFVRSLIREGVIRKFPNESIIDKHLVSKGREYSYADFLTDAYWSADSFAYGNPEGEANRLELYVDLVSKAAPLLEPQQITPLATIGEPEEGQAKLMGAHGLLATMLANSISLNDRDLKFIEGLNFRAKALLDLSLNTGLHLHPFYLALPHQIGAIRSNNLRALELFRTIQNRVDSIEDQQQRIGQSAFMRVPIPALTEVVLGRCKDSSRAIAPELLAMRNTHRSFRHYLTTYEQKWNQAQTKKERWDLKREFDDALKLVLEREARPSSRLVYTLWDIVKEPTKLLTALGDKLVKRGKEEQIIGRVKGLHDFWRDLAEAPPSDLMRTHFNRLFSKRSDDRTWILGQQLAEAVNGKLAAATE